MPLEARTENDLSPLVPSKKEPRSKKSAYLPDSMWKELEQIANEETEARKGTPQEEEISVNWLLEVFLRWSIDDYRRLKEQRAIIDAAESTSKRGTKK